MDEGSSRPAEAPRPPRRRRRLALGLVAVLVLSGIAVGGWAFANRTTSSDSYISDLKAQALLGGFGTEKAAIAQGQAFCTSLEAGKAAKGYQVQQIAVTHFCPEFLKGFEQIPTPQEQQAQLTTELRDKGLAGRFASDAAAVAHAKDVCRRLDRGGLSQGPVEDSVAVAIYCDKYSSGFTVLRPIRVHGTFTLLESDPSVYFPSISGVAGACEGDGGYSDISAGTEVVVSDNSGKTLTTSQLGYGRGTPPVTCRFKFSFTVMDGSAGGYTVAVGSRGELHFTAAELKLPRAVELTLGQ